MSIHICVPTLRRYDLLDKLIESLRNSIVQPSDLWVIDNGGGYFAKDTDVALLNFTDVHGIHHHYYKFGFNLGCAAAWNWFIKHVPEKRIICNDDLIFSPNALAALLDAYDAYRIVSPDSIIGGNAFSCFTMPDAVVGMVDEFDETISPNYAYLEDDDMSRRLYLSGLEIKSAPNCLIEHPVSSTIKSFSQAEMEEHHRKFRNAQLNYIDKWGGLPRHESYTTPYNK